MVTDKQALNAITGFCNMLDKVYEALDKAAEQKKTIEVNGKTYEVSYTDTCYAEVRREGKLVGYAEVETLRTFGIV